MKKTERPLKLAGSLNWASRRPNVPEGSSLYDSDTGTHFVRENGAWRVCPECAWNYQKNCWAN